MSYRSMDIETQKCMKNQYFQGSVDLLSPHRVLLSKVNKHSVNIRTVLHTPAFNQFKRVAGGGRAHGADVVRVVVDAARPAAVGDVARLLPLKVLHGVVVPAHATQVY